MLRIPMDSPFVGSEAVVYTTFGLLRGKIVQMSEDGVSLTVNGLMRHLSSSEIRSIART